MMRLAISDADLVSNTKHLCVSGGRERFRFMVIRFSEDCNWTDSIWSYEYSYMMNLSSDLIIDIPSLDIPSKSVFPVSTQYNHIQYKHNAFTAKLSKASHFQTSN